MSLKLDTLIAEIPFLRLLPDDSFQISLNNTFKTEEGTIRAGLSKLEQYCRGNGNLKLLIRLGYDQSRDGIDVFSSLLQAIVPVLPHTTSLRLTLRRGDRAIDLNSTFTDALRHVAKIAVEHKVDLHLVVQDRIERMNSTAEQFFKMDICRAVSEQLSKLVTALSFGDDGMFMRDGKLSYIDNEKNKIQEIHKFFLALPSRFPRLREAEWEFPIFAMLNGKLEYYNFGGCKLFHLTRMTADKTTIHLIDERTAGTAGTADTRLKGESATFERTVVVHKLQ